jgi:hypothetical protein
MMDNERKRAGLFDLWLELEGRDERQAATTSAMNA